MEPFLRFFQELPKMSLLSLLDFHDFHDFACLGLGLLLEVKMGKKGHFRGSLRSKHAMRGAK